MTYQARTITLYQVDDTQFDPKKSNFDINNMSNVKVYCVLRVIKLVKATQPGESNYVKLEYCEGDISDPVADPMIIGTISHSEQTQDTTSPRVIDHQWRVLWDNKLWCPLGDDAITILENIQGISGSRMKAFAAKLACKYKPN
jgi:hypothetical protein